MDSFLAIASPSSRDSYNFGNNIHSGNEISQTTSSDTKDIGFANNVNNISGSIQQYENGTLIAPAAVIPEMILPNSSSTLLSSSLPSLPLDSENNKCVTYDSINRTINLCGGSVNLSTIDKMINNSDILNDTSPKNWNLNANISVENGATLFINSTDTDWLKINSTGGQAYAIVVYGNLIIDRSKISSWNSTNHTEATLSNSANKSTPRGYLLMHWSGTGQMNITNSNITNLGFYGIKDTWGISYYSGQGSKLQNNTISSNFRGVYSSTNASDIVISNNTIQDSSQHGLNLYKAMGTKILDNKISNNTEHGIFCTNQCENILIKSNYIYDNGRNGIVLNDHTINSTVKQNVVKDNNRAGVAIWNSSNNIVNDNLAQQNRLGITIARNSSHNIVGNNSITDSISNGMLLDTYSTENRIEKNFIARSGGPGVYLKNTSDNTLVRNDITEHSKNGMVLVNATRNELVSNNVYANAPHNYYIRQNSTLNVIRDTHFDNATLRFFNSSSNLMLESTDNRITSHNDEENSVHAFPTNVTLLLEPITKNVPVNTLDMFVIPSYGSVEIFLISEDFDTNRKYKKWFEKSLVPLDSAPEIEKNASTRYIVGAFAPDSQIMIRVNDSFWNAYTSNSSGYIDFMYDGYGERPTSKESEADEDLRSYTVLQFEAEVNNRPTIAVFAFLSALIAGSLAFIVIRWYLKKKRHR